jgi:hypothetical protein
MAWLSTLPTPWCAASKLLTGAPAIEELRAVIGYFV